MLMLLNIDIHHPWAHYCTLDLFKIVLFLCQAFSLPQQILKRVAVNQSYCENCLEARAAC